MTFTAIARCGRTGALGVALTTSAIAVTSRCPRLDGGVVALSAQAGSDWRLADRALEMSRRGVEPDAIVRRLAMEDGHFEHRQVGIVAADGKAAAHTGGQTKPFGGHSVGDGFVVLGNNLADVQLIDAMAETLGARGGLPLEERLVRALEAGVLAGGGNHGQLSAGLMAASEGSEHLRTDLRVDLGDFDAVAQLRRLYDAYAPLTEYYESFWPDNPTVSAKQWLAQHKRHPG